MRKKKRRKKRRKKKEEEIRRKTNEFRTVDAWMSSTWNVIDTWRITLANIHEKRFVDRMKNIDMKLIFLLLADIRGKNEERMCVYIYI